MRHEHDALTQAELTADRIRAEFWRTLDEIDRRRIEAMDWRHHVKSNWKLLAGLGGAVAAMIAARLLLAHRSRAHQPKRLQRERVETLRRIWEHPDRVAPARHSRPAELGSKAITILGTAIATQLARKLTKSVVG